MNRRFDLSKKARADLKSIWKYTGYRWGGRKADEYYRGIIQAITDIAEGKRVGSPFSARPGYFRVRQGRHLIFHTVRDGRIFVSRILHEAMDLPSRLDDA